MVIVTLIFLFTMTIVSSLDESCNDNEYFCQSCTSSPCISCSNHGILSIFYKGRCDDCGCEFQWWWIPGLLIFVTCISCACALICYHSHTKRAKMKDVKQLKLAEDLPVIHIKDEISNPSIQQLKSSHNNNNNITIPLERSHGAQGIPSHVAVPGVDNTDKKGEISPFSDTASMLSGKSNYSKHSKHSCKSCTSSHNNKKHERSKGKLGSKTLSTFIGVEASIADKSKVKFHHNKLDSVDVDIVLKEYKLDDKGTTIGILPWKGMTIIDEDDEDAHNRNGTIICHDDGGIDEIAFIQETHGQTDFQQLQSASFTSTNEVDHDHDHEIKEDTHRHRPHHGHPERNTVIPNSAAFCISLSNSPRGSIDNSHPPSPRTFNFVNSSFPPLPASRKGTEDHDQSNDNHHHNNKQETMIINYHHLSPQPPLAVVNKKDVDKQSNANSNCSSKSSPKPSSNPASNCKKKDKIKKKKGDQKYRIIVEDVDTKNNATHSLNNRTLKKQSIDSGITIRTYGDSEDEHENEVKEITEDQTKGGDNDDEEFEFPILKYKTEINKFSSFMRKDIQNIPIGIVTQCSMDRLPQLKAMCTYWDGIISVAIYINKMMEIWKIRSVFEEITTNNHGRNVCIQIHVVFANNKDEYYPINYLRNVALKACKCKYVFLNDIDFIPSYDLYHKLLSNLPKSRQCLVIPAIEVMDKKWKYDTPNIDEIFKLKPTEIILGFEKEEIKQFQIDDYPNRQQPTDYLKWLITNNDQYQVQYQHGYEPYIIVKNDNNLCEYDERFTGHGMNKIIHIAKLSKKQKFVFNVFCDGFVVTLQHKKSRDYYRTYGKDKDKKRESWIKALFNLAMSELED